MSKRHQPTPVGDKSYRTVPVLEDLADGSSRLVRDVQKWNPETRAWEDTGRVLRGRDAVPRLFQLWARCNQDWGPRRPRGGS